MRCGGALPIYLHYDASDPDSAFAHLARLETVLPVTGAQRATTPLISVDGKKPFAGPHLDATLKRILVKVVGAANVGSYSWHSARIYLACALLASGASTAQIQALCRWQTDASLRLYARLNANKYHSLLQRAARADISSVSTASLPPLDSETLVRQLLGISLVDARAAGAAAE